MSCNVSGEFLCCWLAPVLLQHADLAAGQASLQSDAIELHHVAHSCAEQCMTHQAFLLLIMAKIQNLELTGSADGRRVIS